jgi:hypothetical protein
MNFLPILALTLTLQPQPSIKLLADPLNKLVWDQNATSLIDAQSLVLRLKTDAGAATGATITCSGTANPFTCSTPLVIQTLGIHSTIISVARTNFDGSLTTFTDSTPFVYEIVVPANPPLTPVNIRINKIGALVAELVVEILTWFEARIK